jgi:hypothetical protein
MFHCIHLLLLHFNFLHNFCYSYVDNGICEKVKQSHNTPMEVRGEDI